MSKTSTGQLENYKFVIDDDMDSDTATESSFSLRSRSFLNRVDDRLRKLLDILQKMQCKTSTNVSMIWRMFMSSTVEASVFMGKNYSDNMQKSQFKADVRDIWKVDIGTIRWDFWSVSNQLGKFSMETIISGQWWRSHQSLACKGLRVLRFCVMSWKGESEPNIKYFLGTAVGLVQRFITIQNFGHNWRRTDWIRVEYVPSIHYIAARPRSPKVSWLKMSDPEQFQGRIIFMSMFNDIVWWIKDNDNECIVNATLVSVFAKRFPARHWSFLGPGSEKKWYSTHNGRPQGEWDGVAELMMIKFRESGHPVFRATSPMSRGTLKSKGGGQLSIHFCADGDTIETVLSHNYFC